MLVPPPGISQYNTRRRDISVMDGTAHVHSLIANGNFWPTHPLTHSPDKHPCYG